MELQSKLTKDIWLFAINGFYIKPTLHVMAKFTKELIRERIEGNEVDLSLSQLTTIPVKELLLFPRATFLDLSCNLLSELPVRKYVL